MRFERIGFRDEISVGMHRMAFRSCGHSERPIDLRKSIFDRPGCTYGKKATLVSPALLQNDIDPQMPSRAENEDRFCQEVQRNTVHSDGRDCSSNLFYSHTLIRGILILFRKVNSLRKLSGDEEEDLLSLLPRNRPSGCEDERTRDQQRSSPSTH